jgi:SOS-response transcriptional repressor LexA
MIMTLIHNLRRLRKDAGLSMEALATLCDTTQQTIHKLETGAMRMSDVWIEKISKALKIHPANLFMDFDNGFDVAPASDARTIAIPVIGEVQAGAWTEALQFEEEAQDFAPVDQALLDKWNFKNLYGLRVVGDSMNKVFQEGGIVFIASAYEADINSGDYVVVQRIRGSDYEATVKRMVIDEDAKVAYLQPESTNPKYTPIQIPWPHIGNSFPVVGQDIDRIEVVGKVVTYLAPYPNFVG